MVEQIISGLVVAAIIAVFTHFFRARHRQQSRRLENTSPHAIDSASGESHEAKLDRAIKNLALEIRNLGSHVEKREAAEKATVSPPSVRPPSALDVWRQLWIEVPPIVSLVVKHELIRLANRELDNATAARFRNYARELPGDLETYDSERAVQRIYEHSGKPFKATRYPDTFCTSFVQATLKGFQRDLLTVANELEIPKALLDEILLTSKLTLGHLEAEHKREAREDAALERKLILQLLPLVALLALVAYSCVWRAAHR